MVAANFGDVFPIGGAPDTLPSVGTNVGLRVGPVPFPVYVSSRSATGWTFGTRPGHPDHNVRTYLPTYLLGACKLSVACFAFRKRIYRGVASARGRRSLTTFERRGGSESDQDASR